MAEPVIVPVQLEVQDIEMDFNASEINKELRERLSGVRKTINDIFSEVDPSTLNKAISKSMKAIESDLAKAETAQRQYGRTLVTVGKSTKAYKDALKELEAEQKKLGDIKQRMSAWEDDSGNPQNGMSAAAQKNYVEMLKEYEAQLRKVKELEKDNTPENFALAGTDDDIARVNAAYMKAINAVRQLNTSQEAYNRTLEKNQVTDEYTELLKQAEGYKKKLEDLNAKAKKMEAVGATDKQWEALRYDTELVSKSMDDVIKKMRKAVTTGKAFRFGEGDKQGLRNQINSLAKSGRKGAGEIQDTAQRNESPFTKEYQDSADELDSLEKKVEAILKKLEKMSHLGATDKQFQSLVYDAEQLDGEVEKVKNRLIGMVNEGKAFKFGGNAEEEINKITGSSGDLQSRLAEVVKRGKQAQGGLTALGATHPKLAKVLGVAQQIAVGFGKVMKVAVKVGAAIVKGFVAGAKAVGKVVVAAGKVAGAIGRIGKSIFGAIKNMTRFGKSGKSTSNDMGKTFKKLTKNVLMFGFGFRTAYYAIKRLRTIFIDSFKAMGKSFNEVGEPLNTMIESFNRLKGSLATAFQPIVSVVMPILTRLMNYLTMMLEAIGKFNAALTGQGHIYKAVAKNIDSTAESAGEANKQLGSYDKLEVIQQDSGGGSDKDLGYSYEKQAIDANDAAANFAKMVKDAWAKADFTSVGAFVTEKLLEVLDNIETNLLPKVTGFVNKLLTSINTFLASFGSFDIGEKVGSLVNTLVNGIDWAQVGALFANLNNTVWGFLDGLANGIDWATLGQSIATGITSLFDTLNLGSWAGTISGFANGITTALYNMLTNVDWASVAVQLGTAVNTLFSSLDFAQMGTTISTAFDTLWTMLGNFFATVDWEMIATSISAGINNIFSGGSAFTNALPNIASGFVTLLSTAIQQIDWSAIGNALWDGLYTVLGSLGGALQSSDIPLFQAIGGIFTAIQEVLVALKPALDALLPTLMQIITAVLPIITTLLPPIAEIINQVVMMILPVLMPIIEALMPILMQIVEIIMPILQQLLTELQPIFDVLINTVLPVIVDLLSGLMPIVERILNVVMALITPILQLIAPLIELVFNILDPIIAILMPILDVITLLAEIIGYVLTPILEILNPIISVISSLFGTLGSVIKLIINVALQPIIDIIKFLVNVLMGSLKPVISVIQGAFNALCGVMEFVFDAFTTVYDAIGEGAKKLWDILKKPLNAILGGFESLANGVIKAINLMVKAMNKLSFDVPDWVPVIGGKKFGFNLKTLNEIKIPRLAQGAVIPPNKEFLAMLGDQRHGTNIEAPLDTIKQALAEVLAEVGGGGREPIVLQVNGRTLAQVVWDEQTKRYKQTGKYSPAY